LQSDSRTRVKELKSKGTRFSGDEIIAIAVNMINTKSTFEAVAVKALASDAVESGID